MVRSAASALNDLRSVRHLINNLVTALNSFNFGFYGLRRRNVAIKTVALGHVEDGVLLQDRKAFRNASPSFEILDFLFDPLPEYDCRADLACTNLTAKFLALLVS